MNTQQIIDLTQNYVMNTYARFPIAFVRGEGCYLWDAGGKKYLDFLSGIAVNNLGHSHPEINQVIAEQAKTLVHTSNLFNVRPQAELAKILCEHSFAEKVFFCNSGAEANEAAIKLARRYGIQTKGEDCYEIITAEQSFHGRTFRTMAATGQKKIKEGFGPLPPGFKHVPFNDVEALKEAMGPQTCAVMLEPIQGEGGLNFPSEDYFVKVRELCDEKGILLVLDEIQAGLGRTGKLMAYENFGIKPDIATLAKPLATGLPMGACLASDEVARVFEPGTHATTFGGGFLISEVAKKYLEILTRDGFLDQVNTTGEYLREKLQGLKSQFSIIEEVRGKGLMIGVKVSIPVQPIVQKALDWGLVINGVQGKTIRLVPPLILDRNRVDEGIDLLEEVFSEVQSSSFSL